MRPEMHEPLVHNQSVSVLGSPIAKPVAIENQLRFLIKILFGVKEIFWLYKGFILSYHGSS